MKTDPTPYDQKLASILATAASVFATKGYHNASIRDISKESGVSLSGLYYYFGSKDELLYLIQTHVLGALIARIEAGQRVASTPVERLRSLMEAHLRFFLNNMDEMKVLSHEADSLSDEYRDQVSAKKRRITNIALEILADLRPDSPLDPRVAAFGLFGMMNWLYNWYRPGKDVPTEKIIADLTRLFLNGFLSEEEYSMAESATLAGGTGVGVALSR